MKLAYKVLIIIFSLSCNSQIAKSKSCTIYSPSIKTVQAVVNDNWLAPPVMTLNSDDVLRVSFDEMSHDYKRFIYHIDHYEADWTISENIFESDYLVGFNDNPIEDYQNSINTTIMYTHYTLEIPNEACKLKLSGNYVLTIYDEEKNEKVLETRFMVTENAMGVSINATTNTDIDINKNHQQLSISLNYRNIRINNHEEQIYAVIRQNNRHDNQKTNPEPNMVTGNGLEWRHNKELIFEAGNEYRKFEVLATSHPTMGIDKIDWDGNNYQVYPFACEPRYNYLYDKDANGAFYIRNSDNHQNDITCEYVYVNYRAAIPELPNTDILIDGNWTTDANMHNYLMTYNNEEHAYEACILQKQGYYSYQLLGRDNIGNSMPLDSEGSFYQTENQYQVYIYYKPIGARTWKLAAFKQVGIN